MGVDPRDHAVPARMTLLYTPASPFARKVRVVAHEVGVADCLELAPARHATTPTTPNPDIAAVNPLVKIPTLVLADGAMLYDSAVICEYLDRTFGEARLFPARGERRWAALRLMALADGVMELGISVRYESIRPEGLRWDEVIRAQGVKISATLDYIEAEAANFGDIVTIGQIALLCALDWLVFRDVVTDWGRTRPRLASWHAQISKRPSIISTAPR